MADRPVWRGHLRLALVSCPIALYTAHHERSNLHFHFINPKTGNRVRTVTLDAETDDELSRRDLARGYEFEKDQYVLLDEEDFESARIDSSSMVNVEKFVDAGSIDPVYYDSSYYVVPDGDAGQDVYVVLRDAIRDAKRVALTRVVISRRERAAAIMPMGKGLVLHTLLETRDVSDPAELFAAVPGEKPDPAMVALATQLIDRQSEAFHPSDMDDRYEARLREVIEAKIKGRTPPPTSDEPPDRGNVVDLMAALKRSLGQTTGAAAASAKAPASKAAVSKAKPPATPAKTAAKTSTKVAPKKAAPPAAAAPPARKAAARKRA